MKLPKKTWDTTFKGDLKLLRVADPLSRESAERVLFRITPTTLPGWTVTAVSSHTKELTYKHLVLKELLEELNQRELLLLQLLSLEKNDEEFFCITKLFQFRYPKNLKIQILDIVKKRELFGEVDPIRSYHSYVPRLEIRKIWTEPVRLPPKRFVGVGYKDQGTISSAPSWKEQQLPDEDRISQWNYLKVFLEVNSRGVPPRPGVLRTQEPLSG